MSSTIWRKVCLVVFISVVLTVSFPLSVKAVQCPGGTCCDAYYDPYFNWCFVGYLPSNCLVCN